MRYGGLIIAIVVAAIAALVVLKMSITPETPAQPVQQQAQSVETTKVYVATKEIPVGTVIADDMIGVQPWPSHLMVEGFVAADDSAIKPVGMVARGAYHQNEPLLKSKLVNPSDPNFIAGDLPSGMRVVTIPVNEADAVAGFVFPGDRVDLLYTHDVKKLAASADGGVPQEITEKVTETLLTNVKVLAVDQHSTSVDLTDKSGKLIVPKSASLMVSQEDAQRVRLARDGGGSISMTLRSLADRDKNDPLLLTQQKDISQSAKGDDFIDSSESIKVVRGAPGSGQENADVGTSIARGAGTASNNAPANGLGNPISIGKNKSGATSVPLGYPIP